MSLFDFAKLRPVNDPTIKSYTINESLDGLAIFKRDFLSWNDVFWKMVTVRNFDNNQPLGVHEHPSRVYQATVPAGSERSFHGWGSYLEIDSVIPSQDIISGEVTLELVKRVDAIES